MSLTTRLRLGPPDVDYVAPASGIINVLPTANGVAYPLNGATFVDISFETDALKSVLIPDVRISFFEIDGNSSNTSINYGPIAPGVSKSIRLTDIASPYLQLIFQGLAMNNVVTLNYLRIVGR